MDEPTPASGEETQPDDVTTDMADNALDLAELEPENDVPAVHHEDPQQGQGQGAADLEAVFDVPVRVSAVLGRSRMPVSELLNLSTGNVVELDRKVGEAIDIYVNDRLVARGEVVLVEDKLGVTMTEIIKSTV